MDGLDMEAINHALLSFMDYRRTKAVANEIIVEDVIDEDDLKLCCILILDFVIDNFIKAYIS